MKRKIKIIEKIIRQDMYDNWELCIFYGNNLKFYAEYSNKSIYNDKFKDLIMYIHNAGKKNVPIEYIREEINKCY